MAAPILFLKDIHLSFGATPLIEGAEMSIQPQERLCLVGRNGSGKSTFLKIAAGLIEQDRGELFIQPGTTVRYLPQEPDLSGFKSVLDYVQDGLAEGDDPYRAQYLLNALGLTGDEEPSVLSGGEQRRAALAKTLAPEPDILLLDEPTNHLDLPAIEWLEDELRHLKSAMVLISHDRRFLSNLSKKTLWMDRGTSRLYSKGFESFEDWRDEFMEQEAIDRHKLGRKIAREDHWVVHGVSGRRKRNVKRLADLGKLRQKQFNAKKAPGEVKLTVAEAEQSGQLVTKAIKISKSFGEKQLIKEFSTIINRGDRIGIVGPNGCGKSTLLKLLIGEIKPDHGNVKLGVNLQSLVIDQKREMLDPEWTLKDALTDGAGEMVPLHDEHKHVMSYMKDFLFLPEQVRTPIHALSGGERGRLMLARGFRNASNFLILDEPTNDLDLETLDLLQEMLAEYPGTVILISHDRDFIDRVASKTITTEGDGIWHEYAGGYSDMMMVKSSNPKSSSKNGTEDKAKKPSKSVEKRTSKQSSKPESSSNTEPAKQLSFKHKHALETLPDTMKKLEFEIGKLKQALTEPDLYSKSPKKFDTYVNALAEREEQLMKCEEEWLELEMLREEIEQNN
jgi:ATP-binding cassette subfamily F protein uup